MVNDINVSVNTELKPVIHRTGINLLATIHAVFTVFLGFANTFFNSNRPCWKIFHKMTFLLSLPYQSGDLFIYGNSH
jgi:hypothetical protein